MRLKNNTMAGADPVLDSRTVMDGLPAYLGQLFNNPEVTCDSTTAGTPLLTATADGLTPATAVVQTQPCVP
jgi:hypothetical protein